MFSIFLTSCFASFYEVPQDSLYGPAGMEGQVRVVRGENNRFMSIVNNGKELPIGLVRGLPNGITNEQLKLADLYFKLNQIGENSILEAHPRLRGGSMLLIMGAGVALVALCKAWDIYAQKCKEEQEGRWRDYRRRTGEKHPEERAADEMSRRESEARWRNIAHMQALDAERAREAAARAERCRHGRSGPCWNLCAPGDYCPEHGHA